MLSYEDWAVYIAIGVAVVGTALGFVMTVINVLVGRPCHPIFLHRNIADFERLAHDASNPSHRRILKLILYMFYSCIFVVLFFWLVIFISMWIIFFGAGGTQ